MPDQSGGRDELAATLRRLRRDAGLSGTEAGKRAGLSQASISRYEGGRSVPGPDDVEALARTYGAKPDERRRLKALSQDIREDAQPRARVMMQRPEAMQQRIGRVEHASARIATFCPLVHPGMLQTRDYAHVVLTISGNLSAERAQAALEARMARQALLVDGSRTFTFILASGALGWRMGSADLMAAQLEHVAAVSRLPNVHIGVIPWGESVEAVALHTFDLFDERAAVVGTVSATAFISDPGDVAKFAKLFDALSSAAVFGDDARTILTDAAELYRVRGSERRDRT